MVVSNKLYLVGPYIQLKELAVGAARSPFHSERNSNHYRSEFCFSENQVSTLYVSKMLSGLTAAKLTFFIHCPT